MSAWHPVGRVISRLRLRLALAALAAALLFAPAAQAGALQLPAPPSVAFAPKPGARLPLDAVVRDEAGVPAPLGSRFGRAPVVLVPGYYHCRNLCGTLFEGVLQALALSRLSAADYTLLGISVDPHEDAAAASEKQRAYAALLPPGAGLHLLTADASALARIESALGYRAVPDAAGGEIAHAAGFVVAAPDGRIERYFPGVAFDPSALAAAVHAAQDGAAPVSSFTDRLLLLCAHYDPATGSHSFAAIAGVRAAGLLVLVLLGAWMWRRRRAAAPGDAA